MIAFPNAKINIGLQILDKRADGFHNLETIFYPIQLKDIVEVIENKLDDTSIKFTQTGNTIEGKPEQNLCIKAYHLLKKDFPNLPNIQLHLHKNIPSGAGLGGGSADAAVTLSLLNNYFQLGLPNDSLSQYALTLGSDCPFFIKNLPTLAKGRGEILDDIDLDLSNYNLLLVKPNVHISTADAFNQIIPRSTNRFSLKDISTSSILDWKNLIENDFETTIFPRFPEIKEVKFQLYKMGALYASMSGTGSCLFGIFETHTVPELNFPADYFCHWV